MPFGPVCARKIGLREGGIQMTAFFEDIHTTILSGYAGLRTPDGVLVVRRINNATQRPLELVGRHSLEGINWGYSGSGPADLALSILADFWDMESSEMAYEQFKDDFVRHWGDQWEIDDHTLINWGKWNLKL